jgi:hypothetical protein
LGRRESWRKEAKPFLPTDGGRQIHTLISSIPRTLDDLEINSIFETKIKNSLNFQKLMKEEREGGKKERKGGGENSTWSSMPQSKGNQRILR